MWGSCFERLCPFPPQPAVYRSVWTEESVWAPTPATAPRAGTACSVRSVSRPHTHTVSEFLLPVCPHSASCLSSLWTEVSVRESLRPAQRLRLSERLLRVSVLQEGEELRPAPSHLQTVSLQLFYSISCFSLFFQLPIVQGWDWTTLPMCESSHSAPWRTASPQNNWKKRFSFQCMESLTLLHGFDLGIICGAAAPLHTQASSKRRHLQVHWTQTSATSIYLFVCLILSHISCCIYLNLCIIDGIS